MFYEISTFYDVTVTLCMAYLHNEYDFWIQLLILSWISHFQLKNDASFFSDFFGTGTESGTQRLKG